MIKYFYGDNMTKRKKIKVKKKIKILFTLILLIIISISSIKIYQTFSNKNTQIILYYLKYLSLFGYKNHFLLLKAIKTLHGSIICSNFARLV